MVAVAAGERRLHHRHVHQGLQQVLGVVLVEVEEGGGGRQPDVRPVHRGDQPERPRLVGGELPVAQFEGSRHREVADPQFVDPPPLHLEPAAERLHRPARPGREPGGHDPDRQRQVAAGHHQLQRRASFGGEPVRADGAAEQLQRLGGVEDVEVDVHRGRQPGRPGAPGGEDGAADRPRQQRPDLRRVLGVVEDQQQPPPVDDRPEERRAGVQSVGHRVAGHPERHEEAAEHRFGVGGHRVGAAQVHVELAVRVGLPYAVRHVQGQGRLADAAHADDGGDHQGLRRGGAEGLVQHPDRRRAPGEVGGVRRELGRSRGSGRRSGGRLLPLVPLVPVRFGRPGTGALPGSVPASVPGAVGAIGLPRRLPPSLGLLRGRRRRDRFGGGQGRIALQDPAVQLLQVRPRRDAEFREEQLPHPAVDRQRVRLPPGLVQRPHQQLVRPLVQRVFGGEGGQLGDAARVAAERQVQPDPFLQQRQPQFLQPLAVPFRERAGYAGQRFALPQFQRLVEQVPGAQRIGSCGAFRLGGQ